MLDFLLYIYDNFVTLVTKVFQIVFYNAAFTEDLTDKIVHLTQDDDAVGPLGPVALNILTVTTLIVIAASIAAVGYYSYKYFRPSVEKLTQITPKPESALDVLTPIQPAVEASYLNIALKVCGFLLIILVILYIISLYIIRLKMKQELLDAQLRLKNKSINNETKR